jgi:hypothetical protein
MEKYLQKVLQVSSDQNSNFYVLNSKNHYTTHSNFILFLVCFFEILFSQAKNFCFYMKIK